MTSSRNMISLSKSRERRDGDGLAEVRRRRKKTITHMRRQAALFLARFFVTAGVDKS